MLESGLVSVAKAAEWLGMSRSKVWKMMDVGELPFVYAPGYGNAARRIPKEALTEWAKTRLLGAPAND